MSAEAHGRVPALASRLDDDWRARALAAQEAVLPAGSFVATCSAPFGAGGLGRHLAEIVDALKRREQPTVCISGSTRESCSSAPLRTSARAALRVPHLRTVLSRLPVAASPGWRTRALMTEFDAYAAQRLPAAERLIAFNGQALSQMRTATRAGYESVSLVSANSHLRRVLRQHRRAHEQYPLEGSWAEHLLRRNVAEYARADEIYVASQYTRESFLEEGFDPERLKHFRFTPDPRYRREATAPRAEAFQIVYVGSLSVAKGVPLLIDAVRALAHADIRLVLVGGWGTRGMRRFVQQACTSDARITVSPGDPLPHLRSASLCVHPSYEDGFAYAPAEALACGVPVIVSEDTGMKELLEDPREGLVLPTGDLAALREALDAAYRGEILGG